MKIRLRELARALAEADLRQGYVDLAAGKIIVLAEDMDDEARMEHALAMEEGWQRYAVLPNLVDGEEKGAMRRFAEQREDARERRSLLETLAAPGAVPKFRRKARQMGLEAAWQAFWLGHFLALAREWCLDNGIEYDEE